MNETVRKSLTIIDIYARKLAKEWNTNCSANDLCCLIGSEVGVTFWKDGQPWNATKPTNAAAEQFIIKKFGNPKARFIPSKSRIGKVN